MDSIMSEDRDARDEHYLNRRIRSFIEQFAPKDGQERAEFDMALHGLMRAVYAEAAKPYERTMKSMLESVSNVTLFQPAVTLDKAPVSPKS